MPQNELTGKVALVTGSGRGIGRAIALKLAELGARVAVNDLPGNEAAGMTVNDIETPGGEAMFVPADIRDRTSVKTMVDSIVQKWGGLDILVNNAGILGKDTFLMRARDEDWDAVLATNLRGAFLCTKAALRYMLAGSWGRIISIASVAALAGAPGRVSYASSKGGLISFTKSLALEVGSRSITVNAIAPGMIVTDMTEGLGPEAKEAVLSRSALKRLGTPRDVAELAGFLATDRASFITGQVICVDGGEF